MRQGSEIPPVADVVIIGGGAMGVSIAFHLAEAGVGALLLERDQLGSGSTSRAAGGVRAQFSDALNIQIAQRSLQAFGDFGKRPGWDIDFKQVGYLFALTRPEDLAQFEANVALQQEYGVPSRILSPAQAAEISPLLAADDLVGAAFSPDDGHATPEAVVQGYAYGARANGAQLRVGCEVLGIEHRGGQIQRVVTDRGTVETHSVICAAGAWSQETGRMVDVDLPVTPLRRQILFTEPMEGLPDDLPMTIDFSTSFYFHREGPGLLVGMSDPNETPGFKMETSDDWIPGLIEIAERRAPKVASVGIRGGWAGLYEVSPDHNAIIGEAQDMSRFIYATGFSGHGFLQAPAVGEIIRDLYLERAPFVDISPLGLDRFEESQLRPEFNVV
jgi:sarcosine oxidase, subunit beta